MRGVEQIPWVYDALLATYEALGLKRWRQWLVKGARGRTLDIGCGTGRNLPLYGPDVRTIGVDPAMDSLRKARARAPHVPLVRASAHALPFRDGAFDTVVSGLVFCSVPDVPRGLGELERVLKKSGALRMLEHVRSTGKFGGKWQDLIQPAWTCVSGGCHPNRDTEANVTAAGFEIDPTERKANGTMRRFVARPQSRAARS